MDRTTYDILNEVRKAQENGTVPKEKTFGDFMRILGNTSKAMTLGSISQIPRVTGNIVGFGADKLGFDEYAANVKREGVKLSSQLAETAGLSEAGEKAVGLATEFAIPVARLPKGVQAVRGGKTAQAMAEGALAAQTANIAAEGEAAGLGTTAIGAGIGAAFPVLGAGARLFGEGSSALLGKTTGAGQKAVKEAFKHGGEKEFTSTLRGEVTPDQVLSDVRKGLEEIKDTNRLLYGKGYKVLEDNKAPINIKDIRDGLTKQIKEADISIGKEGKLNFSKSAVADSTSQSQIQNIYKDMVNWDDRTGKGLDTLRKRIDSYWEANGKYGNVIVQNLKTNLKHKITNEIPEYREMVGNYEKISSDIQEITKTLALGTKASQMTALTRLNQSLKDGIAGRIEMVNVIEKYTGKNITAQLAGVALQDIMPKGLAGFGAGTAGFALGGFWSPHFWAGLATASPRIVGEIANTLGISQKLFKEAIDNIFKANQAGKVLSPTMKDSKLKKFSSGFKEGFAEPSKTMNSDITLGLWQKVAKGVEKGIDKVKPPMNMNFISDLFDAMDKNDAWMVWKFWDYIQSKKLKSIYKDILNTPIYVMDKSVMWKDTLWAYDTQRKAILIPAWNNAAKNKINESLLEEWLHAMRDLKWRLSKTGTRWFKDAITQEFIERYLKSEDEKIAKKWVESMMNKIVNPELLQSLKK